MNKLDKILFEAFKLRVSQGEVPFQVQQVLLKLRRIKPYKQSPFFNAGALWCQFNDGCVSFIT